MNATTHLSLTQSTPEYTVAEWEAYGPESVIAVKLTDLADLIQQAFRESDCYVNSEDNDDFGIEAAMKIVNYLKSAK